MRARWKALRESFVRSITTLKADRQFKAAAEGNRALQRFEDPEALLGYLPSQNGDLDEKDQIYEALVRGVQSPAEWSEVATSLLWLGLWPGLDAIYGRQLRDFANRPDELVEDISFLFTTTVARIDLAGVSRLASTLIRNVERDLRDGLKRRRNEERCVDELGTLADVLPDGEASIADRDLPVDARDLEAVKDWLTTIVGADADLVIGAALLGFDLHELAVKLGISHETARKRFQRAILKLKGQLSKKVMKAVPARPRKSRFQIKSEDLARHPSRKDGA
jgi:DNA-directed RNA polymerase specialized sigma24 family protein